MHNRTLLYAASALAVLLIGALDYLTGPEISFSIFYVAPVGIVAMKGSRSAELAATDALTGLANTRTFYTVLEREIERMARSGQPLTLAYMDLDNFKTINDEKGHSVGDELLRLCATTLSTNVRVNDTVARLGGDEFAIIFPETRREVAEPLLARMRRAVAKAVKSQGWAVSLSVGAVTTDSRPESFEDLVRAADGLMYRVKTHGKDGMIVELMPEPAPPTPPTAA